MASAIIFRARTWFLVIVVLASEWKSFGYCGRSRRPVFALVRDLSTHFLATKLSMALLDGPLVRYQWGCVFFMPFRVL